MRRSTLKSYSILCPLLLATVSFTSAYDTRQSPAEKDKMNKKSGSESARDVDVTRWRLMLDKLTDQARFNEVESNRPLLLAEVADAYWILDAKVSSDLFMSALETALSSKSPDSDPNGAIRQVLARAARCNAGLAKRLTRRLIELRADDPRATAASVEVAIDLLGSDPKTAAQLVEAAAPAGLSGDSAAVFILQLAERDLPAAEKVYRAYLTSLTGLAPAFSVPLGQLLWLAGYPFGYGEAYGFTGNNPARMLGFGGRTITGLTANSPLARTFLDIAFKAVQKTLQVAPTASPAERDALSGLALFATAYLSPEVTRYYPERVEVWAIAHQHAVSGTPDALRQQVTAHLQLVASNRSVAEQAESPEYYANERIQTARERIEKQPDGCERDRGYAQVALMIAASRDYAQAFDMAQNVKDIPLRNAVVEFIYYDMTSTALKAENLIDAKEYARRVELKEQRTLLNVKIAAAALRQTDRATADEFLTETQSLAAAISEAGARAAVLLASAAVRAEFDPFGAAQTLRDAIKAVNQSRGHNADTFAILRRVKLACPGDTFERWYGSRDQAERFSLLETLALLSKNDLDGCILMAQGIEDPATRIRALVSIAKAALQN